MSIVSNYMVLYIYLITKTQGKGNVTLTNNSENFPTTPFSFFLPSLPTSLQLHQKKFYANYTPLE